MDSETERSSLVDDEETKEDYQKKKESGVKEYKIEQQISAKKQMNDKYKVFVNIYKFYKYIILDETLVCLNKSLKFLTKYETIIISTMNKYDVDQDGYLNTYQLRMLMTIVQRFLFNKIFINYLLPNISKYYQISLMKKTEIENLIDMLLFLEPDKNSKTYNTDDENIKMKSNIIKNLNKNKFIMNYYHKKAEFNEQLGGIYSNNEEDIELISFTEEEENDVIKSIKSSFTNKFKTLENQFIDIQGTILWWSVLKNSLLKELKHSDKKYLLSIIIFIKQMLIESIYSDIDNIEHLSNRVDNDHEFYKIYKENLINFRNMFNNNETNDIVDDAIIEKQHKKLIDDLEDKYKENLTNNPITNYKLANLKNELISKDKIYVDILKIIANASEKTKDDTEYNVTKKFNNNKMTKQDFKVIVETLIIYLKQNLLNFFSIYKDFTADLKIYQFKLNRLSKKLNY